MLNWNVRMLGGKKIEAFEILYYKRILKIKWANKVKSEKVLQRIGAKREIWNTIERRVRLIACNFRHLEILTSNTKKKMIEGENWNERMSYY